MGLTVKLELQLDNGKYTDVVKECIRDPEDRICLAPHSFNREILDIEKSGSRDDEHYLIMCHEGGVQAAGEFVPAGFLVITIERWQRCAGYFMGVLPVFRRKGIARAAIAEMLSHCFGHLGLNRVGTCVINYNEASFRLHKDLFVHEGTLRQVVYAKGQYHDEHHFGLLASEWNAMCRKSAGISREGMQ